MESLEVLYLRDQVYSFENVDLFDFSIYPPNLLSLNLSYTNLNKTLDPRIRYLKSLQHLDLTYCFIEFLPEELGHLQNLKTLILMENKISKLPELSCPQLTELNLYKNPLEDIHPKISNIKNLQVINLKDTKVKHFPLEFFLLTKLRILDAENTLLESIPPEIKNLQKLEELNLHSTKITHIPPEIGELRSLETLFLSNLHISEIPTEIGNLTNLKLLHLNNCYIEELPKKFGI